MKENTFEKLKLKILGKYETITAFCKAMGFSRAQLYEMLSGKISFIGYGEKIIDALELTPEEANEYIFQMNKYPENRVNRNKLKLKIKGTYGTIRKFSEISGITAPTINYICAGRRDGSHETWVKIQECLNIPDSEMWSYIKKEKVNKNGQ